MKNTFCAALFLIGLMGSLPVKAAILFDGEWDDFGSHFEHHANEHFRWKADNRPSHWFAMQAADDSRITVVNDPTSPKHGAVARIEVRPGDTLGGGGERAEVSDMLGRDPSTGKPKHYPVIAADGHEYYGIAVKLSPDWQSPGKHHGTGSQWGLFAQLHSPDIYSSPPAVALAAENDFHLNLCAGELSVGGNSQKHKDAQSYSFTNGDLNRGHWVEFMLDVVWSTTDTGSIAVYRRDEGEAQFTKVLDLPHTATLQTMASQPEGDAHHYWKNGFYRSWTAGLTNVLWLGPFVRGTSFNEVARTAFGNP